MPVVTISAQDRAIARPSLGNIVYGKSSIGNVLSRISRDTAAFVTLMLQKLVEVCDCLFLGEGSTTDTLVESTELPKGKWDTSDVFPVRPISLFSSRNSIAYIFHIMNWRVKNATDTTAGAATAVLSAPTISMG
ncbi:unnamed protein product [Fusarium equiseti]|uniref:Uncharacterized protein n=1 Tax=Fusarium equiseti TaxID=61235 RepID=A0A8J2NGC1_FUSEQ|nr:unnamed protein product [Fusarium equiseti]